MVAFPGTQHLSFKINRQVLEAVWVLLLRLQPWGGGWILGTSWSIPPPKKIKQIQRFFAGLGNPPEKVHVVSNKCHSRKLLKWPLPRMTTFSLSNSNRAKQDASWIVHLTILWEELTSFLWGGTIQCPWLCWCSHYDIHSLKTRDLVTKPQKLQTLPCWIVIHQNS